MIVIAGLFLIFYTAARINSHVLLEYVVERTLIQKSPSGSDPAEVSRRFRSLLDDLPDKDRRTDALFTISRELEKVQLLSPGALDDLLDPLNPEY